MADVVANSVVALTPNGLRKTALRPRRGNPSAAFPPNANLPSGTEPLGALTRRLTRERTPSPTSFISPIRVVLKEAERNFCERVPLKALSSAFLIYRNYCPPASSYQGF